MARIDKLLARMTLEEKVSLLAGTDMWRTPAIPRLGIPAMKVTDGPNGARGGGSFGGGVTSACFPVGTALASTWNCDLIKKVGRAIGQEAKTKGSRVLLAPTVNIHRSPLGGRDFECYSEDPYLTAQMAVSYIRGVQSEGVAATIKHFVCNESEFQRMTISSEVGERALREIYLPPFEAAVLEADVWAVMSAYNRVNGVYASENPYTLTDILRGEWGFQGLVMSDWFGTKSTVESVAAGQDLEMPGPPTWRGEKLLQAVKDGEIGEDVIDARAHQVLWLIERVGLLDEPLSDDERAVDVPEHRALIRQAGGEGIVLLKNEGNALPLDPGTLKKVALIGPNCKAARIMGGGSSRVNPHHIVSPFEAAQARLGEVELGYEIGAGNFRQTPALEIGWVTVEQDSDTHGMRVALYNGESIEGQPVDEQIAYGAEQMWLGQFNDKVNPQSFCARLSGWLRVPEDATYLLGLSSSGLSRLVLDGETVIDRWSADGASAPESTVLKEMTTDKAYRLQIDYSRAGASFRAGVRLGCMQPIPDDAIERAANLAAESDVALVFVGLSDEWDSEGHDRPDMELVGEQNTLVTAVAAANPRTVVVLQSGAVCNMPWLDEVAAVMQAWYPGQECGDAIVDVLLGETDASGRLPTTWPKRLQDTPAYINYPGENGKVLYGEGLYVGYRYYDAKGIEPLFPFGHGLSYTTFEYGPLTAASDTLEAEEQLTLSVEVTNGGWRAGQEVVQLYMHDVESSLSRPEQALVGFGKVSLAPGETQRLSFAVTISDLAFYDDQRACWVAEAGAFEARVGSSSRDIRSRATFALDETVTFGGASQGGPALDLDSPLGAIYANPDALAVLQRHLPALPPASELDMAIDLTLKQLAGMLHGQISQEALEAIEKELAEL